MTRKTSADGLPLPAQRRGPVMGASTLGVPVSRFPIGRFKGDNCRGMWGGACYDLGFSCALRVCRDAKRSRGASVTYYTRGILKLLL